MHPPGPSPRAWGLHEGGPQGREEGRSIPTCVGTTWCRPGWRGRVSVHPHVRGDYINPKPEEEKHGRSIPTCVGTTLEGGADSGHRRSIPTCVGTTITAVARRAIGAVHPHVRGDYGEASYAESPESGPSPRAWGLPFPSFLNRQHPRSIPTCVGTTYETRPLFWQRPGHPHVRGDYPADLIYKGEGSGPSPRAWGLHTPGAVPHFDHRSIPTCVGTTETPPRPEPAPTVHPHVRGDYSTLRRASQGRVGPSPRAWGLQANGLVIQARHRSIPTCVGTTPLPTVMVAQHTVHPHVRGDYT